MKSITRVFLKKYYNWLSIELDKIYCIFELISAPTISFNENIMKLL